MVRVTLETVVFDGHTGSVETLSTSDERRPFSCILYCDPYIRPVVQQSQLHNATYTM